MVGKLHIKRYQSVNGCTFGHLFVGFHYFSTLENTSKIVPAGTYELVRRMSPSFRRKMWYLLDVPGRSSIMIHSGNTKNDTNGCILVGVRCGFTLDRSRASLDLLESILIHYDKVILIID